MQAFFFLIGFIFSSSALANVTLTSGVLVFGPLFAYFLWIGIGMVLAYLLNQLYCRRQVPWQKHKKQQSVSNNDLVMQQQMLGLMSKELKLLLNTMTNTPASDCASNPQVMEHKKQVVRLMQMTGRMLCLQELSHSQAKPLCYLLHDTLNQLTQAWEPLFKFKQQTVTVQVEREVWLSLQQDVLERILCELLSNALKFTPNYGQIGIAVKSDSNKTVIVVSDNGCGITDAVQQRIFARYSPGEVIGELNKPSFGLLMVKEMVEYHQGKISLMSEPGKGCTVTVIFPVGHDKPACIATANSALIREIVELEYSCIDEECIAKARYIDEKEAYRQPTVLLIDNNADMLELLQDILKGTYNCISETNPTKAIDFARQQLPDLVVCDEMMPENYGVEVLRRLKSSELTEHIPLVMLTTNGGWQSVVKSCADSAEVCLAKPFNSRDLLRCIADLLIC